MTVSFQDDICPLFTETDIDHMAFFCDLSNYDDVKANADDIMCRLNGTCGPVMPPAATGGPWTKDKIALFAQWIKEGCPR